MTTPALNQDGSDSMGDSEVQVLWKKHDKLSDDVMQNKLELARQEGRTDSLCQKMEHMTQRLEAVYVEQKSSNEKLHSSIREYGGKVDLLMETHHKNAGKSEGMSSVWKWIVGATGLAATIIGIVVVFL